MFRHHLVLFCFRLHVKDSKTVHHLAAVCQHLGLDVLALIHRHGFGDEHHRDFLLLLQGGKCRDDFLLVNQALLVVSACGNDIAGTAAVGEEHHHLVIERECHFRSFHPQELALVRRGDAVECFRCILFRIVHHGQPELRSRCSAEILLEFRHRCNFPGFAT